jgi:hypothetical protein
MHHLVCDLAGCAIKLHGYRGTEHESQTWDELRAVMERYDAHMLAHSTPKDHPHD